ncbi:hypothetical protein H2201_005565 [Coniosporium apollinis]|uniref:J domain-containing protein n=1 Tax=Coniosporium apollinis TaxID=61459 RepID=A0ABQ9NTI2_9PEZI|nr:hypothetical protein H2201_005565 [Coniosporium apollinis]
MSDLISNYECTQQPSRSNAPGLVPSLALPKHVDWGWCTLLRSAVVAVPTHFSTNRRSAKETCTNITVAGLNSDNNGYNHTGTVAISKSDRGAPPEENGHASPRRGRPPTLLFVFVACLMLSRFISKALTDSSASVPLASPPPLPEPEPNFQEGFSPLSRCGYNEKDFSFLYSLNARAVLGLEGRPYGSDSKTVARRHRRQLLRLWHPDKVGVTGLELWQHESITHTIEEMYKQLEPQLERDDTESPDSDYNAGNWPPRLSQPSSMQAPTPESKSERRLYPLSRCGYGPQNFTFLAYPDPYKGLGFEWGRTTKAELETESEQRYQQLMLIWQQDKADITGLDPWQHVRIETKITRMYNLLKRDMRYKTLVQYHRPG